MELARIKACKGYFEKPEILVQAIKKYSEISKVRKGEYTLLDLLK